MNFKVSLDDRAYILCYKGVHLREVYFMDLDKSYFFSCRTDMSTMSHYYRGNKVIRRYEQGKHNRNYFILSPSKVVCYKKNDSCKEDIKVEYITYKNITITNTQKLKKDLESFLKNFARHNLYKHIMKI